MRRFVCLFEGSRSGVFKEDEEEDYEDYEFDNEDDSEGELELEIEWRLLTDLELEGEMDLFYAFSYYFLLFWYSFYSNEYDLNSKGPYVYYCLNFSLYFLNIFL